MLALRFRAVVALLTLAGLLVGLGQRVASAQAVADQTVARCGKGWLEIIDGYPVLHLKGTHYEMGYQQGALLKERVASNMHNLLVKKGSERIKYGPIMVNPRKVIESITEIQRPFVPKKYFEEMEGLAAGAGLKLEDVIAANFIPEMFHCSGFALMNSATQDGTLFHGRVLDYGIDWGLQDHAVVVVAEPDGGIPFVNVTYAGFIGSVTGMNSQSISVGEMGGGGLGNWKGVPMALLVRETLETAHNLDEAIKTFRDNPRTCQYFYVIADGKSNRAVGMEASWNVFTVLGPGEKHVLLPNPVKDAVLLSAGDRYVELSKRAQQGYGKFDVESALRLMDRPVAMKSNLHNVLFEPKSTRFWVANASTDRQPAATQKYYAFQLSELLKRSPATGTSEIKLEPRPLAAK